MAKKILVCPVCGSVDLQYESPVIGTVLPYYHCNNCGNRVMPIEFESIEEVKKYADAKKKK